MSIEAVAARQEAQPIERPEKKEEQKEDVKATQETQDLGKREVRNQAEAQSTFSASA